VRVTKEQQSSQNAAGEQPAGVEANLPKPKPTSGESKQSNDQTQKREELTNYEVSSKRFRRPAPASWSKIFPWLC
jgi:flagellar M-ring protein FliF